MRKAVSLLSTMDFQPDSRQKVSLKRTKRFKTREQHIEHTCEGADQNRQVLTFVTTMVGPQQLEFSQWKKRVSVRTASTTRTELLKKIASITAVREKFST